MGQKEECRRYRHRLFQTIEGRCALVHLDENDIPSLWKQHINLHYILEAPCYIVQHSYLDIVRANYTMLGDLNL